MVWCGITKYVKTVCHIRCKPIEFPHLGIFLPIMPDAYETQSKLTEKALSSIQHNECLEVKFLISQAFLNTCGGSVTVANSNQIQAYDPVNAEISPLMAGVQHFNLASIAKVCDTDIFSVELILREIVAQLRHHLQKGCSVRLLMKVGNLISRNGELHWKSLGGDESKTKDDSNSVFSRFSRQSVATVNSC